MASGRTKKTRTRSEMRPQSTGATTGYESQLWQMADALRGSMDAAEHKHVVLGLIFLKYISDAFEERHAVLAKWGEDAAEDRDEYIAENIFWVPPEARWAQLKVQARQSTIGLTVNQAMAAIERENPALKDVLPKDYARPALDKQRLGQLIDIIGNIRVGDADARSRDVLGRVYEYFLSQFASAEGKKGAVAVRGARIPSETVMVSCIGSDMGKSAIAGKACVTNQQINSVVVESPNCPLFVYYNLSMRKEEIRAAAGGSEQPILNKSAFGQLNILLPTPPRKQRAIAHILGTLDDKIELNRRMNETLEAMARALFKSWFVDFDPVRAKMESRDTGLPRHLADFFPDRLVDSELGPIPQGWEVKELGLVVEVVGGTTPSTKVAEYWSEGTHCWATPKDLSGLSSPVLLDTERKITVAGLTKIGLVTPPKGYVASIVESPDCLSCSQRGAGVH